MFTTLSRYYRTMPDWAFWGLSALAALLLIALFAHLWQRSRKLAVLLGVALACYLAYLTLDWPLLAEYMIYSSPGNLGDQG